MAGQTKEKNNEHRLGNLEVLGYGVMNERVFLKYKKQCEFFFYSVPYLGCVSRERCCAAERSNSSYSRYEPANHAPAQ